MSDDNPFASPDPGREQARPDPRSAYPAVPSYQEQWQSPYGDQRRSRFVPRSLLTACHVAAGGAWTFVACVLAFRAMASADDGGEIFASLMVFLVFGSVLAILLFAGLVVALVGLVAAVPLIGIWRSERDPRDGRDAEHVAIAHAGIALAVMAFTLLRIAL